MKNYSSSILVLALLLMTSIVTATACEPVQKYGTKLPGPPPPIPYVGPVDRDRMTYRTRHVGACGPMAFDLQLDQVEVEAGTSRFSSTITRWLVRHPVRGMIGAPLRIEDGVLVSRARFDCYGEDRLIVTLNLSTNGYLVDSTRVIEYTAEGVVYDQETPSGE